MAPMVEKIGLDIEDLEQEAEERKEAAEAPPPEPEPGSYERFMAVFGRGLQGPR